MTLGAYIKKLREQKGWEQVELARKLGVNQSIISEWENDNCNMDVDKALKLAVLLDADGGFLIHTMLNRIKRRIDSAVRKFAVDYSNVPKARNVLDKLDERCNEIYNEILNEHKLDG